MVNKLNYEVKIMREFDVNFICRVCKEDSVITIEERPESNFQIIHDFIGLHSLTFEERRKHNCEENNCDSLVNLSDAQIQAVVNDWFDVCLDCNNDRMRGESVDDAYHTAMASGSTETRF